MTSTQIRALKSPSLLALLKEAVAQFAAYNEGQKEGLRLAKQLAGQNSKLIAKAEAELLK